MPLTPALALRLFPLYISSYPSPTELFHAFAIVLLCLLVFVSFLFPFFLFLIFLCARRVTDSLFYLLHNRLVQPFPFITSFSLFWISPTINASSCQARTYHTYYLVCLLLPFSNHLQSFKSRQNGCPRTCSQSLYAYVPPHTYPYSP